jgi:hypothetical protein
MLLFESIFPQSFPLDTNHLIRISQLRTHSPIDYQKELEVLISHLHEHNVLIKQPLFTLQYQKSTTGSPSFNFERMIAIDRAHKLLLDKAKVEANNPKTARKFIIKAENLALLGCNIVLDWLWKTPNLQCLSCLNIYYLLSRLSRTRAHRRRLEYCFKYNVYQELRTSNIDTEAKEEVCIKIMETCARKAYSLCELSNNLWKIDNDLQYEIKLLNTWHFVMSMKSDEFQDVLNHATVCETDFPEHAAHIFLRNEVHNLSAKIPRVPKMSIQNFIDIYGKPPVNKE